MSGAYEDAAAKARIQEELRSEPASVPLVTVTATEDEVLAFAAKAALPASFVLLVRAMGLRVMKEGPRAHLLAALLEAVPVGREIDDVCARWLGWAFSDPEVGPSSVLVDADARAFAAEVAALQLQAHAEAGPAATWRRLRTQGAAIRDRLPKGAERSAVMTIANGCWDLGKMPGTVVDVFNGWMDLQAARAYASIDFSREELEEFADKNYAEWLIAREQAPSEPADTYNARVHALTHELLTKSHPSVAARGGEAMRVREEFWLDAQRQAETRLLALLTGD